MPVNNLTLPKSSRRASILERAYQAILSRIGFAPLLALLGILSELIYLWFFVRCFPLLRYYDIPLLDMGKITNHELGWGLTFMGAITALFALYWLGLRLVQSHEARTSRSVFWVILLCALVFSVSLLFVYPWGAADIYDYAIFGRVLVHYQANPFVARGIDFPNEPFISYAPWSNTTVAYGPLWLLFAAIASLIAQADLLANLFAYKIMVLLFYWLMIGLIALIWRAQNHKLIAAGVLFWAWNPLVLLETMANGHNDAMMIAFVLLALYLLMRRRAIWSMISLAGAALIKFTSVLIAPLFLIVDLKEQRGLGGKLRYLVQGAAAFLLTILLVMAPFWSGRDPLALERRIKMFTTSLPTLFANALVGRIGAERAAYVAQFIAAAILGLFCLYLIRRCSLMRSISCSVSAVK